MRLLLFTLALVAGARAHNAFYSLASEFSGLLNQNAPFQSPGEDVVCPTPLECPPGWTGQYCDIELCINRGIVALPPEDLGFPVDIRVYKDKCNSAVAVPVDSHINALYLMIDAQDFNSNPTLKLVRQDGDALPLYKVIHNDTKTLYIEYKVKPGMYSAFFSASKPCVYQAHADSELVIPVAFTSGSKATHNDQGSLKLYHGERSYAIVHGQKLKQPGSINVLEVYEDGDFVHAYDPNIRYKCNHEIYFGPIYCDANRNYYYKILGLDENGFDFMRTDKVLCDGGSPTTTPVPITTPAGPCMNGGTYQNGKCTCTDDWTGDKCETIVCFNGGRRAPDNECICPSNFTGTHCHEGICQVQHLVPIWSPNFRSFTLVVQNDASMKSSIRTLQNYITEVVEDFIQHHQDFITQWGLVTFDANDATPLIITSDPYAFMEYVHHINIIDGEQPCAKKANYALIHALANVNEYGLVYVYTNSPDVHDSDTTLSAQHLLGLTKAKVNYFVVPHRCGDDNDLGYQVYDGFADFSGGQVYKPNAYEKAAVEVIQTFQQGYMDVQVDLRTYDDCSQEKYLDVFVDSRTAAFTVSVHGNNPKVQIMTPDSQVYKPAFPVVNDTGVVVMQAITPCPDGWYSYQHNCYLLNFKPMSWTDARDYCHAKGATLTSVLNPDKQYWLNQELKDTEYWIGLNDIEIESRYVWDSLAFEIPLSHFYENWGPNQPDDQSHTKNCVSVNFNNQTNPPANFWNDRACVDKKLSVCEKHAFDLENLDNLQSGVWKAKFSAEGACKYNLHAQSDIQVYYGFSRDQLNDYPDNEPLQGLKDNRIIANVSNMVGDLHPRHNFYHFTTFFDHNQKHLGGVLMNHRRNCSYHFVSDEFECPAIHFGLAMNGVDGTGTQWQRIRSALCFSPDELKNAQNLIEKYKITS
jgi:hypothetical protein